MASSSKKPTRTNAGGVVGNDKLPKKEVKAKQAEYEKKIRELVADSNKIAEQINRLNQEAQTLVQQRNQIAQLILEAQGAIKAYNDLLGEVKEKSEPN